MTGACAKDDVTAVLQGAIDGVVCLLCLPSIRNPDKLAVPNVDAYSCTHSMRWKSVLWLVRALRTCLTYAVEELQACSERQQSIVNLPV